MGQGAGGTGRYRVMIRAGEAVGLGLGAGEALVVSKGEFRCKFRSRADLGVG